MKIASLLALLLLATLCFSAQDSDFVRAQRTLGQIENGLKYLKPGDVKGYNRLIGKLDDAQKLINATGSKNDPAYPALIQRYNASRNTLSQLPDLWKQAQTTATGTPVTRGASSSQIYNQILEKYQPRNRPKLPDNPTVSQMKQWVGSMSYLANDSVTKDAAIIDGHFAAGRVNKQDKRRFDQWVKGTFATQIRTQLSQTYGVLSNGVQDALNLSAQIDKVDDKDVNTVVNVAGSYLPQNKARLAVGLQYLELAGAYDAYLKPEDIARRQVLKQQLNAADQRLDALAKKSEVYMAKIKKMPKKSRKNATSQYLWLNGSRFCEITQKGEVWIESSFVGSIEPDGKVWVSGNYAGSFENNGKVWHKGNFVGTLEANGAVWKRGSQVGSIAKNGKVWIGGSARGEVDGPGDWRRAAIVYYYDFFK